MTTNNASRCSTKCTTEQLSFGHKAIAVALSAILLGFGWPAVSPASSYAATEGENISIAEPERPSIPACDYEVEVGQSFDIVLGHVFWERHKKWKSSDESIATVKGDNNHGVYWATVTGVKPGLVEILYTYDQRNSGQLSRTYRILVKKAPIAGRVTLTGKSVSSVYDGASHAAGTATATDTNGHNVVVEYQKADGSWTENPADITATNVADSTTVNVRASVPDYYEGYVEATEALSIDKRPVGFTGESAAKKTNGSEPEIASIAAENQAESQTYAGLSYSANGSEQEITGIAAENLVVGQTWEGLSYSAKGAESGYYDGAFSGKLAIKAGGQDVTANYEVTKTPGKLTITESQIADCVTLTTTPVSAVYDGKPHAAGTATATDANGHAVRVEYQKADGTWTENPADIAATNVADSTTVVVRASVPGYYEGYVYATEALTVTHRPVAFNGASGSKLYTGSEQEIIGITAEEQSEDRGLVSGQTWEGLSYSAKGTDPGYYDGTFAGKLAIKAGGQDVTANYEVTQTPGKLTIAKSDIDDYVTLSDTLVGVVYDGKPHAADAVDATDENGHDVVVEYLKPDYSWTTNPAEITATNVADSTLVIARASVPDYYEGYTYTVGILFIDQRPVSFTGESATKEYNGSEQEITGITAEGQSEDRGLVSGQTWEGLSYSAKGTAPSTYDGAFTGDVVIKADGQNVTENYEVTQIPGTLTITESQTAEEDTEADAPAAEGNSSDSGSNGSGVSNKSSSATKAGSTVKTGDAVAPFAASAGIAAIAAVLAAFLASRKRRGTRQ